MVQFLSWAQGKRTYITIGVGLGVAVAQFFGVHIPDYVDFLLGLVGLGFARVGAARDSKLTQDAIRALVDLGAVYNDVKPMVTTDDTTKASPNATVTVTPLPPVK